MEQPKLSTELEIIGIAASSGIAIGKAYVIKKNEFTLTGILLENESNVLKDKEKFDKAVLASVEEVEMIKNNVGLKLKEEEIDILETHIEFLTDPQIRDNVFGRIDNFRENVNDAFIHVIDSTAEIFKKMSDAYMSARASDVRDIGNRILRNLKPISRNPIKFKPDTIIIAEDIQPSEAITFDLDRVVGFATQFGGKTSHTAILAKAKRIPAVVGCGNFLSKIKNDDVIVIDGLNGVVIVNPSDKELEGYWISKNATDQEFVSLQSLKNMEAITSDGIRISLMANISHSDELAEAFEFGAEGAGLFRTELLFMNRDSLPTEDEQFEFYKNVAIQSKGKPVVVRTIDIGGDKPLSYLKFPSEENPFLGYRAIRFSLDRKDVFATQLKAILRASVFGNFKIMFPMISNIQEIREVKEFLEAVKMELQNDNIDFNKEIPIGIMMEVPSAAITADILAKEVDFFSIGTNDLCQYTLAVDRGNEKIRNLYNPYNPSVLRLIRYVIEQANKDNVKVSLCGELASDPQAIKLLIGMGLREFSMNSASIPVIKDIIKDTSLTESRRICEAVMTMDNSKSITDYLLKHK